MQILIGKNSGFCFGVKRAIAAAENLKGENNYILGEIIHNDRVINKLAENGLKTINSLSDVDLSDKDTLLIRTHGEPKSTFDFAAAKKINVIDGTCPFVKEIQKIVEMHYQNGFKIVIIGNGDHPEVKGINGWCNESALITEDAAAITDLSDEKICIVVQTTYSERKFDKIIENFKYDHSKTVDIFKTICYTTTKRQKEAEYLSRICDAMLVIGGLKSNNTKKLFDICSSNCENTFYMSDTLNFDYEKLKNFNKMGIVFGASTPFEQFQEVISKMEKITEEIITTEVNTEEPVNEVKAAAEPDVENIAEKAEADKKPVSEKSEMEKAFNRIGQYKDWKIGKIVTAKISSANDSGLTISIKDAKQDFELAKEDIIGEYDKENYKDKIGSDIRVMVVKKNPTKFSERAMAKVLAEEKDIAEIEDGKIFEAVIESTNKGGLIGKFGSYQVFVPASQIKLGFVKNLESYVGKTLRLKAEKVESKGARRQIVGSQKVILEEEKRVRDEAKAEKEREFFASIQEGDVVIGTPVRFAQFGAFVDVNGYDCLAHISDLSWTGCKDCAEVLELNKQYEFVVLKIDEENKRVSIGYKQLQPKPWDSVPTKYAVGDVVKGKVVRILNFGAFVELEKGIDGLVHVSQMSNKYLENPASAVEVGQEVEAKILAIDLDKEKITLSIKALLPEEAVPEEEKSSKKGGKAKKSEESSEEELREWKDTQNGGVSIADLIKDSE